MQYNMLCTNTWQEIHQNSILCVISIYCIPDNKQHWKQIQQFVYIQALTKLDFFPITHVSVNVSHCYGNFYVKWKIAKGQLNDFHAFTNGDRNTDSFKTLSTGLNALYWPLDLHMLLASLYHIVSNAFMVPVNLKPLHSGHMLEFKMQHLWRARSWRSILKTHV